MGNGQMSWQPPETDYGLVIAALLVAVAVMMAAVAATLYAIGVMDRVELGCVALAALGMACLGGLIEAATDRFRW